MVGRLLVGFVWLNLQISVSCQVDFQGGSCVSIFSFLCHGRQTFSGVRVAQSFVFCVMVGRLLVGFLWLNLLFSVSWLVDFQWGSCGSIVSFLCHGWQIFSGVRVAQSLVFCVMVGRLLVGFVWLNLQFSVSWLVDFQWGSCGSIFSFLCHGWQTFSGVRVAQSLVLCHGRQIFRGVRVAQSLVVCVMVGRFLVEFVWLNLYFSVTWLVDFQGGSCGSIFSFLCHGWQTFSGVRVTQSLILCNGWYIFSGVRVAQSLVFCVMVGRFLVGFVWLNLLFSVSWLVDFQWGSCVSIVSFLCHGWQIFSGVRVAQSLVFCVMVGRLLVGFVWLNLQFSVSWLVDFQWGSCGSIFSFLCYGWQTVSGVRVAQSLVLCHGRQIFRGVRVAQSLVFCVMVGRLLVGFVWLNVQSSVMVGKLLVGFVRLNLQFSVSWLVYFQWGSCGSNFSFLCHGRQTFIGFRVAQSIVLCHGRQTFSEVRVAQSLVFCVMVGRLLVGFVWLNLQFCVMVGKRLVGFVWLNRQFSVSWLVDFQWGSCGFVGFQWGSCVSIFIFLCHGWQTFSWVRVAQSLVFCVIVGRLLVGFVWLNLVFCVMVGRLLVGFVWLYLQFSRSWLVYFYWGACGSIFSFLCHGWQTFSGVRVAQSLVFCVMVGRFLVGFVWLNLQFSVSWLVDFQWGSCGSIFSFLCHGWWIFSGVRVAQSLVFCVMVGRLLVGFVWLNLQFCVMVGRFLVGFVWLNLQFSVTWLVDFQGGSCGSIFSFLCHGRQIFSGVRVAQSNFLCHGWQTFSGVRVAQSLVFCVMVGKLLVGFVWLNLEFSV